VTRTDWLLDVTIDGREYRWSVLGVDVDLADGSTRTYPSGLGELTLPAGGDAAAVEVRDPSVDWPTLARHVEGRPCTVRRWLEGTVLEDCEAYATGEAVGVSWGGQQDPVSWSVERRSGAASLGHQLPDPLARVDVLTWPVAGAHEIGSDGAYYPIVLGYPGQVADDSTIVACMPAPIGQWKTATYTTTRLVICEDDLASITSVTVRNDDLDLEGTETATRTTDLLGRHVCTCNFSNDNTVAPSSPTTRLYVGFSSAGGGGPYRAAYDVIVYLLRRYGPESVDWTRLPEVADALALYQVDTWIDQPVSDPWAWLEGTLLADLPVEIRSTDRGRYLVARRYVSDPARRVGSLDVDRGEATRISAVSRDGAPINEFVALFRAGVEGDWLGRVVLTGDPATLASAPRYPIGASATTQRVTIASSGRCLESASRWGLRQDPTQYQIDWTWDTATVLACLDWRAQRQAVPALVVDYEVRDGESLREGDEVLLTDDELGLTDEPAIIDEPPVRGVTTSVTLRLPEAG
jgi:hypothetical protein